MDDDRFAWVRRTDEVVDQDHPDWAFWDEAHRIEDWIASGDDPEPPTIPAKPSEVHVPALALTLTREEAAAALRISVDTYERHVRGDLREVKIGSRYYVPVDELQTWVNSKAARALRG